MNLPKALPHVSWPPPSLTRRVAMTVRRRVRTSEAWLILVAAVVGVLAGAASYLLAQVAHGLQAMLFGLAPFQRLSGVVAVPPFRLLALPLGGALLGLTIWAGKRRRRPIDVVEANALHGGRIPAMDSVMVVGQTLISNGFGASVGLEAAYAQAGGGIASSAGTRLGLRRNDVRTLVGAGAGAAIAAGFGAPLAGLFYAFEIVIGAYTPAAIAPVAAATIAGAITARAFGAPPYLIAATGARVIQTADYLLYALLGVVCAGIGIVTMRLVAAAEASVRASPLPDYARPVCGGLILILLASISPQTLSSGHAALNLDIARTVAPTLLATIFVLKLFASVVSLGFGFRGGLFFASLFLGSLLGRVFAAGLALFPNLYVLAPTDAALVGMAAFAVAIVGGPMTMALLVLEATHDFALTGVVLTASLITSAIVRERFGYSFSTWRLHLRGETLKSGRDIGWIRALTADRMMRTDVPQVPGGMTIGDFRRHFPLGSISRVIAVGPDGRYLGLVETAAAFSGDQDEAEPVGTLAILRDAALTPDMDIQQVMSLFDTLEADDLAVLSPEGKVAGVLTEKYVRRRYAAELEKAQLELYGES